MSVQGWLERKKDPSAPKNAAGEIGSPITPILSETAGARAEISNFLYGLIAWPA
jgi:hypothetical protein